MTHPFVHPYIPNTAPESRAAMLAAVGAASVDEFYADVPGSLRLGRPLDLPEPFAAEQDLAAANSSPPTRVRRTRTTAASRRGSSTSR